MRRLTTKRRGRVFTSDFWGLSLACVVAVLAACPFRPLPLGLVNITPSEPVGIYLREDRPPTVGDVIAFALPPAAQVYETRRGGRLTTFLKTIAAVGGDHVCVRRGALLINGTFRAPLSKRDHLGLALPNWDGCRKLGSDEFFVFSNRVPNSFDSRYFGPVQQRAIVGVYRQISFFAKAGK